MAKTANLLRGGNVPVQKSRREIAYVDVVESVTALIVRQERCGLDLERKKIPNRVLVLGTIETPQRLRTARIRIRRR